MTDIPIQDGAESPLISSVQRDRVLGTASLVLLAVGFAVLIAMAIAVTILTQRNRAAFNLATTTRTQLSDIARAVELLDDAETSQRGFLLTEREAYLLPYEAATGQIRQQLDIVVAETSGLPIADTARDFRKTGLEKFSELSTTIDLYKSGGRGAATEEVLTDRGKGLMDEIRAESRTMTDFLTKQLAVRLDDARYTSRLLAGAQIGSTGLVLVIAVLTGFGLYRNVTALRRAQAALTDANSNLEEIVAARTKALIQANDEIQKFAYIVSHDLRAPLVNIMGFTTELEAAAKTVGRYVDRQIKTNSADVPAEVVEAIGEDVPEAFEFIKTSTSKMDRLISAILRLSREGRRILAPETLVMRDMLENIAGTLKHRTDEVGAQIVIQPLPNLVADRLAIEQVFGNLLDNAVKYLSPGRPGVITVRGTAKGAFAHYEIEDNGRGIGEADLERVFELFRRAGAQDTQGEGIGLAYVRQLVYRLGGTIGLKSTLGQGTIFTLTLPVNGVKSLREVG